MKDEPWAWSIFPWLLRMREMPWVFSMAFFLK
jgi:hypothetical protein